MNIFFSQRFHWDETCTLIFQQYLGRRQQLSKNNGKRQVESNKDLLQASATETPDTVKETYGSSLIQVRSSRMVVIIGIQGYGNTFLQNRLPIICKRRET